MVFRKGITPALWIVCHMQGLVLDGSRIVKRHFLYLCVWNSDDIIDADFEPFSS